MYLSASAGVLLDGSKPVSASTVALPSKATRSGIVKKTLSSERTQCAHSVA
jgi:midasin (ATPase involved in ribosome maturation)